ncbi:hypothetical protein AVEN_80099-1 [Araneus ventricosus]|uniref:Uncharacterized protein n=1 Tax=Araneus ventricosus TaxID=182803 RepID=A0A4Y2VGM2_ARAVE|nr:hypothetical protein AVEN_80099-1 [Araneus ventricosus]
MKPCIDDALRNCTAEYAEYNDKDYNNEASDGYRQRFKGMQRLIDVTTELCDENSELHQTDIKQLQTLTRTAFIPNFAVRCAEDTHSVSYDHACLNSEMPIVKDIFVLRRMNLFHINCFIIKSTTACDSGVKQPILEIIEKGGRLDDQCPNSSRMDVLELLDALKLVSPEEIHSKELIRVNSFFKG